MSKSSGGRTSARDGESEDDKEGDAHSNPEKTRMERGARIERDDMIMI